ncbi:Undecaprenyl-phosphate 4-deoxy-4-formamido-L-arabinose transferase [subsurface metagenome]
MSRNPYISVIMPCYNGAQYLREAIESILNQTFHDFEFVIINDGSTDASQEIIDSFNDDRMLVIQQKNMGITKSLNKGLEMARGEYIARQDADDISFPDRFEKQVAYLDAHPEVAVLGGAIIRIDEKGNPLNKFVFPQSHEKITKKLYKDNQIVHSLLRIDKTRVKSSAYGST